MDQEKTSDESKRPRGPRPYDATIADARPAGPAGGCVYQTVREIGGGGMGKVLLARDANLNRWVALKRLSEQFLSDPKLRIRFEIEAKAVASLGHFHIVQVYTFSEDAEGPYIAMEYVPGPGKTRPDASWSADLPAPPLTLHDRVETAGPLELEEAVKIGVKLCSALGYAHRNQVIHRDVKPANILLNEESEPKLTDFGLARQVDAAAERVTLAGAQLLTLGYGAPEQETDASKVDGRADIYGLAATLWFALTGQSPRFFRESEVPDRLRPVLTKALEKNRERRYASAKDFEEALRGCVSGPITVLQPVETTQLPPGFWRCDACGQIDRGEGRFCQSCGADRYVRCPKCGAESRRSARYCGACGAEILAYLRASEALEAAQSLLKDERFDEAVEKIDQGLAAGQMTDQLRDVRQQAERRKEHRDRCRELRAAADGLIEQGRLEEARDRLQELLNFLPSESGRLRHELEQLGRRIEDRSLADKLTSARAALAEGRLAEALAECTDVLRHRGDLEAADLRGEVLSEARSRILGSLGRAWTAMVLLRAGEAREQVAGLLEIDRRDGIYAGTPGRAGLQRGAMVAALATACVVLCLGSMAARGFGLASLYLLGPLAVCGLAVLHPSLLLNVLAGLGIYAATLLGVAIRYRAYDLGIPGWQGLAFHGVFAALWAVMASVAASHWHGRLIGLAIVRGAGFRTLALGTLPFAAAAMAVSLSTLAAGGYSITVYLLVPVLIGAVALLGGSFRACAGSFLCVQAMALLAVIWRGALDYETQWARERGLDGLVSFVPLAIVMMVWSFAAVQLASYLRGKIAVLAVPFGQKMQAPEPGDEGPPAAAPEPEGKAVAELVEPSSGAERDAVPVAELVAPAGEPLPDSRRHRQRDRARESAQVAVRLGIVSLPLLVVFGIGSVLVSAAGILRGGRTLVETPRDALPREWALARLGVLIGAGQLVLAAALTVAMMLATW